MKEAKYLGMIMDEHLSFKNHMDTVKLKLNSKWVISQVKALCEFSIRPLLVESSVIVIFYVIFLMRYAVIINYIGEFFFQLRENRE